MRIGFDAKRIFENNTGLGNYSRSLVASLAKQFPQHQYSLFAPKQTTLFNHSDFDNISMVAPAGNFYQAFPSLWRRSGMTKDISKNKMDIFHGLSNELPAGIERSGVRSVVTIHDLIFERYPETYHFEQRYTHRWKMKQSCKAAGIIIAASNQTRQDLVDFYHVPAEKITVCYQNCHPAFEKQCTQNEKEIIRQKYGLPETFFLFVSSVTKRKNLIAVCKAMLINKEKMNTPLVVIGDGKAEKAAVKKYLAENGLLNRVVFLNELPAAKEDGFVKSTDFPAIYQQALALVYPSIFEGFGIPILEAFWSSIPVLSSNTSSLPEVAADAALYFSPNDVESLATKMLQLFSDAALRKELSVKGLKRAGIFTAQAHAAAVMNVYLELLTK